MSDVTDVGATGCARESSNKFVKLETCENEILCTTYVKYLKRTLDIIIVALTLPITLPLILALAAIIFISGGRPFYVQERVGRNGKVFRLLKIRTMVKDADLRLREHLLRDGEARYEWNASQKLKKDPRITLLGRALRKTSLDELPQLWNVIVGDMSLVGPRPMTCDQRSLYPSSSYFLVRPGITGLWQTSARNDSNFTSRAFYDNLYVSKISIRTDLLIMVRTVFVVLRGTGY